jgi:hypothetical protein
MRWRANNDRPKGAYLMKERNVGNRGGLKMAMKVAAIGVGLGGIGVAASADAQEPVQEDAKEATRADGSRVASGEVEDMKLSGISCWGTPISRGPLAPPEASEDFDALVDTVPA